MLISSTVSQKLDQLYDSIEDLRAAVNRLKDKRNSKDFNKFFSYHPESGATTELFPTQEYAVQSRDLVRGHSNEWEDYCITAVRKLKSL